MVENIPKWLRPYLDKEGAARIEQAVIAAERKTSGEIVPMLVHRSTIASHSGLLGALILLLFGLCVHKLLLMSNWLVGPAVIWDLALALCAILGYGLSFVPMLQRLLIPRRDQKLEVERRAMLAFYEAGLAHTDGRTGILLFVSFFERQAVVLADKGIAQHCQPEEFHGMVRDLVLAAKQKRLVAGFEQAIARCEGILKEHFPPCESNPNELKDHLRISW